MNKDGRSIDHKTLEGYRFAAIKLRKDGVPVATIAKSFGVTSVAVYIWLKKSRTDGIKSLKSRKAPGPEPELSKDKFPELIKAIRRPASKYGYATDLWSGPRLRHFIKHHFNVNYHNKHMPRFLRRLGLNFKFPERRAIEQDPKAVKAWKKDRLPEILKYAKKNRSLDVYKRQLVNRPLMFPLRIFSPNTEYGLSGCIPSRRYAANSMLWRNKEPTIDEF